MFCLFPIGGVRGTVFFILSVPLSVATAGAFRAMSLFFFGGPFAAGFGVLFGRRSCQAPGVLSGCRGPSGAQDSRLLRVRIAARRSRPFDKGAASQRSRVPDTQEPDGWRFGRQPATAQPKSKSRFTTGNGSNKPHLDYFRRVFLFVCPVRADCRGKCPFVICGINAC